MLARLQQVITLVWLAAALGWLGYFLAGGRPVLAVVGALLIVAIHALVLGLEFVLVAFVNRGDPAPPAGARLLARAWWREVRTATRVFGWRQPYRSNAEPDHLPRNARGRRGVVLIHGFFCNRALWNPWMRKLRAAGVPFVAVNLEPVLGSIDRYPARVEDAVRRVEAATGLAPVLVGHSMGGLAARAWLQAYGADRRMHHVITIGTPHAGTWMARFGFVHNTRQMRHRGEWTTALAQGEGPERLARFTCFYSHCDNIALPASTATLPGADNRHIAGMAHVDLAFHDAVFDEVMAWLERPAAAAPPQATPAPNVAPASAP